MFVIQADKSRLTVIESEILVSNAVDIYPVRFNFSDDWDGFAKVAVFYNDLYETPTRYSVLIDQEGMSYVPREVLTDVGGTVRVGVCGESASSQHLPTIVISLGVVQQSICDEYTESEEPTPNIYQQILSELASIRKEIEDGKLVGPQGPRGFRGPQGEQGIEGPMGPKGEKGNDALICGKNIVNIFPGMNVTFEETGEALIINAFMNDGTPQHFVRYYDWDGKLLYLTIVADGSDAIDPVAEGLINTPIRPTPTEVNSYNFVGWNLYPDSQTANKNALENVTSTRNLYAIYILTGPTYSCSFYNGYNELLQSVSGILYGTRPEDAYTGETPLSKEGSASEFPFLGWLPSETVTQNGQKYYADFATSREVKEITDSWDEIIAACKNGTYKTKYKLGNYKPLQIGDYTLDMQIVGIDRDELSNNGGYAPLSWISIGCYGTVEIGFSRGQTWETSNVRKYMRDTIFPVIPDNVRNAIKEVKKSHTGGTITDKFVNDTIWAPGEYEINGYGGVFYSPRYKSVYPDAASRSKEYSWVLRNWTIMVNPSSGENTSGYYIGQNGDIYGFVSTPFSRHIVIGFCT